MKLDHLRHMALFSLVAKEGSFTAVAQQQNLAVSAISAAISQLEAELGVRLLHRSTRKLALSDEGKVFLQHCRSMLFAAEMAHEALSQLTGQLAGELTITASLCDAERWLLPALTPLLQANPKLTLNLLINDHNLDLVEKSIDIAIRGGELEDSSLVARALSILPEVLVAAPHYLATAGTPLNLADLSSHKIIAFLPFERPQSLSFMTEAGITTIQLASSMKTDSVELARNMALAGFGIARLPRMLVKPELASQNLVEIMPDYPMPKIHVYAITIKRDLQPKKVSAALAAMQTYLAAMVD